MAEIKLSEFLKELRTESLKVGNFENPPFTAERLIVAVIDIYFEKKEVSDSASLLTLIFMLECYFEDLKAARDSLYFYIDNKESMTYLDDMYMKNRIVESKTIAEGFEEDEVSSFILMSSILNTPSDVIKRTMLSQKAQKKISEKAEEKKETDKEKDDVKIYDSEAAKEHSCVMADDLCETREEEFARWSVNNLVSETKRIRKELRENILGQDNAINVFTTGYYKACMAPMLGKSTDKPKATFLFAGPPGVGKTLLAKEIANSLGGIPFKAFDMSGYSDNEANLEFCGFAKSYRDSKPGNVTEFVRNNPKCVLLFDEIEKAHICIIHLFLQILDEGRVKDNFHNEDVSFKDAIIIMTTNAGKRIYESRSGDLSGIPRKVIIKALEKDVNPNTGNPYFPSAICSRFASGNVVMFNHIDAYVLRQIAKKEIGKSADMLSKQTDIDIRISEDVYTAMLLSEGGAVDARTITARSQTFFNNELYELFSFVSSDKVKTGIMDIEKIRLEVDLSDEKDEIINLFVNKDRTSMLVYADEPTVNVLKNKNKDIDFIGVSSFDEAVNAIKECDVSCIFIDMKCGETGNCSGLNIADNDSTARDFFKFLGEENNDIPIYILETAKTVLSEEEKLSFMSDGVVGFIRITSNGKGLKTTIGKIAQMLYQQKSLNRLARENKLVTFETSQTISKSGKEAVVRLFDLKLSVAVDSEDFENVLSSVSKPDVHFEDVIGAKDAKDELLGFVDYLKAPRKYLGTGVKAPKGVLLYGPPGTGKTMLAKAMACEADVTFLATEGNQFLKKLPGEGSEKVHELFRTARKYAPSILFIDEIETIAKERIGLGSNEEGTLTAFLTEMDGFVNDPTRPVFVLAATNFDVEPGSAKSLDSALMRRFDRRIFIDLPDKSERKEYMSKKISGKKAFDVSDGLIENISLRSIGMSLAQIDSVIEFALRSAIRNGSTKVDDEIFEEAFETFNGGEIKKWSEEQLERVARHEAGHALVCSLAGKKPSYMTIVARGDHGGYMAHSDDEIKELYTRDELLQNIRTSLGGRAAEIVCYGKEQGVSSGAYGDLRNATIMARRMVCSLGMCDDFGLAVVGDEEISEGGELSEKVRKAVNDILDEQMKLAIKDISRNREKLDSLVSTLMVRNHLTRDEIQKAIFG